MLTRETLANANSRLHHDVLIVGGGPAGATCARFCARHGLNVAVIERFAPYSAKRTSAGIFDHTWKMLELSPDSYPHPMKSPNAATFKTLNNGKELTGMLSAVVSKLNRYVYFPNRDEFDGWLLSLAMLEGASVVHNTAIRPHDIDFKDGRYRVQVGNQVHTAEYLVGAAGTCCPVYRRYFGNSGSWPGATMFLTEVEVPESKYSGPPYVSYFNFMNSGVFGWTYIEGDGRLHLGTAILSKQLKIKKADMLLDEFVFSLKSKGQLPEDFKVENHPTLGGSIRMFAKHPMSSDDGSCFVIGDSAGLLQLDAYNGITNAILSGRLCADAISRGERTGNIRNKLHRYLFTDVLHDMIGNAVPILKRIKPLS